MKRLNPKTSQPFKKGDVRDDGYVFAYYQNTRIKKDGFCKEVWLSPEMFAKDVEDHKKSSKNYYAKNAAKENTRAIAWKQKNRDRANEINRASWDRHSETNKERLRQYRQKNREVLLQKEKDRREANPHLFNARVRRSQAARVQRTPKWLTPDDFWMIEQSYELAALRTKMFGFKWHVDHIIPLKGKRVSGLHTPLNLQVIPASVNFSKNNKFEVG